MILFVGFVLFCFLFFVFFSPLDSKEVGRAG